MALGNAEKHLSDTHAQRTATGLVLIPRVRELQIEAPAAQLIDWAQLP
jgi:hypothetical protein